MGVSVRMGILSRDFDWNFAFSVGLFFGPHGVYAGHHGSREVLWSFHFGVLEWHKMASILYDTL